MHHVFTVDLVLFYLAVGTVHDMLRASQDPGDDFKALTQQLLQWRQLLLRVQEVAVLLVLQRAQTRNLHVTGAQSETTQS